MWTAFQRLGGVYTLGYPVSQRYVGPDGFTYQAFQGGVLQWRPELGDAVLANTFEIMESAGKGDWLTAAKGLPKPIADDGSGGDFQKAFATRMSWLTDDAIKEKVLANPNPRGIPDWSIGRAMEVYGLPMSRPEQHGPFVSQLFQRISLQKWTVEVPGMPAVGSVSVVLGGDLLKEAGMLPASATQPLGPGGVPLPQQTPPPAPAATAQTWQLKQVGASPSCDFTSFSVNALDANGNGVNGLIIRSWNDQGNVFESGTRNRNGADGSSDRVISASPKGGKWYVMLVDGQGRQSSNVLTINFTDTCDPGQGAVNQIALQLKEGGAPPSAAPSPGATAYPWRIAQVGAFPNCGTTYVRAVVVDAGGRGLNGVLLTSWSDQGDGYTAGTSFHDGIDGYWERVFGAGVIPGKWYVAVIDSRGGQMSNVAIVTFTGNCDPNQGAVQEVELTVRPN